MKATAAAKRPVVPALLVFSVLYAVVNAPLAIAEKDGLDFQTRPAVVKEHRLSYRHVDTLSKKETRGGRRSHRC